MCVCVCVGGEDHRGAVLRGLGLQPGSEQRGRVSAEGHAGRGPEAALGVAGAQLDAEPVSGTQGPQLTP